MFVRFISVLLAISVYSHLFVCFFLHCAHGYIYGELYMPTGFCIRTNVTDIFRLSACGTIHHHVVSCNMPLFFKPNLHQITWNSTRFSFCWHSPSTQRNWKTRVKLILRYIFWFKSKLKVISVNKYQKNKTLQCQNQSLNWMLQQTHLLFSKRLLFFHCKVLQRLIEVQSFFLK